MKRTINVIKAGRQKTKKTKHAPPRDEPLLLKTLVDTEELSSSRNILGTTRTWVQYVQRTRSLTTEMFASILSKAKGAKQTSLLFAAYSRESPIDELNIVEATRIANLDVTGLEFFGTWRDFIMLDSRLFPVAMTRLMCTLFELCVSPTEMWSAPWIGEFPAPLSVRRCQIGFVKTCLTRCLEAALGNKLEPSAAYRAVTPISLRRKLVAFLGGVAATRRHVVPRDIRRLLCRAISVAYFQEAIAVADYQSAISMKGFKEAIPMNDF